MSDPDETELAWSTAEDGLFALLLAHLNPVAPEPTEEDPTPATPPAVWTLGKNALLGFLPAAQTECWALATGGAPGDNTHNAGVPPMEAQSFRMGGVVLCRFRSRKAALAFLVKASRLFTVQNSGNIGCARVTAHADVEPDWTKLAGDDTPSLTWLGTLPLEIVYGDVVGQ